MLPGLAYSPAIGRRILLLKNLQTHSTVDAEAGQIRQWRSLRRQRHNIQTSQMPRRKTKEQVFKNTMRGIEAGKGQEKNLPKRLLHKTMSWKDSKDVKEVPVAHPSAR